jgi:O-antigen/teichoic acid export membrane protein
MVGLSSPDRLDGTTRPLLPDLGAPTTMASRSNRLLEAAKKSVPEGTYTVGLGLIVSGLTAYGFQILAFRALPKAEYTALNGLWVIAFVLAPGFFLPLEQEVGRAIAHRRSQDVGGGPVVRRAAVAGAILCAALITSVLLVEGVLHTVADQGLADSMFHGKAVLLPCLLIALATYAVQHLTRGTLSGNGRFGPYGMVLAAEGIYRIVPAMVLYAAGIDNLFLYGLVFALPPVFSSITALWRQHGLLQPGPEAPWSELSTNLGWLFGGSVLAQALSYAPVMGILVLANGKTEKELAADFIVGFFLARIPILLFQAVQAALLPKLAGLIGSGRHDDFKAGLRKLLTLVIGIGVLGVVAGYILGPTAGEILFGNKFTLDARDLALLAAGSGLFILAMTLAQALIAMMGHARATYAWVVGNVAFWVIAVLSSHDLFLRVELGFVAGSGIAALVMGLFLGSRIRHGIPEEALENFVDQIEHEQLEI